MSLLKRIIGALRQRLRRCLKLIASEVPLVSIGRHTYGSEHVSVFNWGEPHRVVIGNFCSLSAGLKIFTGGNHRVDWISTYPFGHIGAHLWGPQVNGHPLSKGDVKIGNDVWIGRDVTILSGVNIGDGAVVGANSLVVSHVPPYSVVGGNPARVLKMRFDEAIAQELLEIQWWHYPDEAVKQLIPYLCSQHTAEVATNLVVIRELVARFEKYSK